MDAEWERASRRFGLSMLVRYFAANLVLSPIVAALALLASAAFSGGPSMFTALVVPLAAMSNLAAWLWATRQALLRSYPEGRFVLMRAEGAA